MFKNILKIFFVLTTLIILSSISSNTVYADPYKDQAVKNIFGEITAPTELLPFINAGGSGAGGISLFLNNLIILVYEIAAVIFVFMLLWGAFDWITSGGDKEKIAAARKRLINSFIGIILFAIAFAVITVFGVFTGFEFYKDQDKVLEQSRRQQIEQKFKNYPH